MIKPLLACKGYLTLSVAILASFSGCTTMKSWVSPVEQRLVEEDTSAKNKGETVKQFESTRDKALLSAADARWQSNDIKGCETTLLTLLSRSPDCVAAQLMLADLYAATNRQQLAEEQLQMALNQYPNNAEAQHSMALLLEEKGDAVGAAKHFDLAVKLEPQNEIFQLSQKTANEVMRVASNAPQNISLASAQIPVTGDPVAPESGLTLRFKDDNIAMPATAVHTSKRTPGYPQTTVGDAGVEDQVDELKAILKTLPRESGAKAKPLGQRRAMIRLPS